MFPFTLQFLIAMIGSAINERLQRKLDYSLEEVRVLKEILCAATGKVRISFTADQSRRLAVLGAKLSPEERRKCCQVVSQERSWGGSQFGRAKVRQLRVQDGAATQGARHPKAVVKMALENLNWDYTKIATRFARGCRSRSDGRRWRTSWRRKESSLRQSGRRSGRGSSF